MAKYRSAVEAHKAGEGHLYRSQRKPHNHYAGYVCELKSKHAQLPGHFVVVDGYEQGCASKEGGDPRWYVMYEPTADCGNNPTLIGFSNQRSAREMMKHAAAGGNDGDFGQN